MNMSKNYIRVNKEDLKELNTNEVLVLNIIRCYNANKKYCRCTINTFTRMIHCSERTIDNTIKSLKEKSLIFVEKNGVNSLYYTKTNISINSFKLYTDLFKNADLDSKDMIILSMLEDGMDRKDIHNYISRTTVYRAIQKLKELELFKELAEVDEEYLSYFDDVKRTKRNSKNRFNNFTQRNYSKKYFEEYEKIFFN